MEKNEFFDLLEEHGPVKRVAYGEALYLADPKLEYVENQPLFIDGMSLPVRMYPALKIAVETSNPFTHEPKYFDVPIQRMPKHEEELSYKIEAYARFEADEVMQYGEAIQPIELYDANTYEHKDSSLRKKATLTSLGLVAAGAITGAVVGLVRYKKKK